jgi:hypothetical protein
MSARRPVLATLALLCVLVCALVAGVASAGAVTRFGGFGEGAGQFKGVPRGVAVDQAAGGDVYVADPANNRVDVFDASGKFVMAWGWGVLDGVQEAQTCTVSCQTGLGGEGAGEFSNEGLGGLAVDDDPLSSSYGDVYVTDSNNKRVDKFDSSGKFLLSFGERGPGNGQFQDDEVVALGPEGKVYVGDETRVQVFEPSGVWLESILLPSSEHEGTAALAVDASGDVFVAEEGVSGVREFEPDGVEMATQFDVASTTVTALAVDGSGDLFVGESSVLDSAGAFRVFEYSPSGEELASFDNESILGFREGMAFTSVLGVDRLYVSTYVAPPSPAPAEPCVTVVGVPVVGAPVIEPGSVSVTPGERGVANVNATVDADGEATSYRVEYVDEAGFQTDGYAGALSTPEALLGSKLEEAQVSIALSGLTPGVTYHYRLVLTSSVGSQSSPDQTFMEVPPALISGPWVADVTDTSATFAAEIDPLGVNSEYRIEYGTSTTYGQSVPGSVGEGESYVPVGVHRQDLTPGTLYHYRVTVHNEVGSFAGPDHMFTTQVAGGQELSLADGRAWELVSPPNKKGALLGPLTRSREALQAATDGRAIVYSASEQVGEGGVGHRTFSETLSERAASGWSSQDISARNTLPPEGEIPRTIAEAMGPWQVFSSDLSVGLYEPGPDISGTPQSAGATERTLYLRDSANATFLPLETPADVPSGTKFGDPKMTFLAATPDLSHVIFGSSIALTPEALEPPSLTQGSATQNLYEWSGEGLQLVNITPDTPGSPDGTTEPGAYIGSQGDAGKGMTARAVSSDGRWVVWTHGQLAADTPSPVSLYVRDTVDKRSFRLGGGYARFETMSSDGSMVFFIETNEGGGGDLYVFDTATGTQTDLTADHGAGELNAGVQDAVMGASEDGSYLYFVATGVLASGAVSGEDNVYVLHNTASGWKTTFIATLSGEDSKSWRGQRTDETPSVESPVEADLPYVSSRVSPNGRYLAFMSERSLTGYDNLDAVGGQPDEEVYLYDSALSRLVCASCNPTGARPVGLYDDRTSQDPLSADLEAAWSEAQGSGNHWLAGSVPGWERDSQEGSSYQPRYLSDDGRLFFDSPDALVPQDTNGLEDVYEYEPTVNGETVASDDCTVASAAFSERSGGCVSLISAGQSSAESIFVDASENGDDVFFETTSKLTGEDEDTSDDIYDAHVCLTEAPCHTEPVSPPPCASGDSCKAAPSPQPEIFGPAPSATFSGIGNVVEETKANVTKHKPKPKPKSKSKRHAKHKKRKAKKTRKSRSDRASGKAGR